MKNNNYKTPKKTELPMQIEVSFKGVYEFYKKYAEDVNHPYHKSALIVKNQIDKYPFLIDGFSDLSIFEERQEEIEILLTPLFPEPLLLNEIKAATIPFIFHNFKFSTRFETILRNAGNDYELSIRNLDSNEMYIQSCTFLLAVYHNYYIDLKRPFFFDIPNKKTGVMHHYRVAINNDFFEVSATDKAPEITEEDYKTLLDNYDNIEVWKEKFPPNSYIFKGFGLVNLFDVTAEEILVKLTANLLQKKDGILEKVQLNLQEFYNINDLKVGFSVFTFKNNMSYAKLKRGESLILPENQQHVEGSFFCSGIIKKVFKERQVLAISNVKTYGKQSDKNNFYKALKKQNINSIILVPIQGDDDSVALIEIGSPRAYELNSVNQNKLRDVIPVFEAAVQRYEKEEQNELESFIQENYTSIHPSVKWRFYESAEKHLAYKLNNNEKKPKVDEIIFNDVYPLFAQLDIKGSSTARNEAIQDDLTTQLTLAITVLKAACENVTLPIYKELMFRIEAYLNNVKDGLKAGDEVGILDFLKRDIYPVFNHIKTINSDLNKHVTLYTNSLDKELQVVYKKRKAYESSVTYLNEKLAAYLDKKQDEAQAMFPHYFERYITDGIEYNMYIGQSLVRNKTYSDLFLYNLRLWQLQNICEMENVAFQLLKDMDHELRVASLILIHSNPLAIKFRMDEKQFDVDGAYNIRYEIIKKRIDKAHIKGTTERLTVLGKIAIVYSQNKDAREYTKYIKYLQSKNVLGKLERLDLEDLQGVYGLKALRVEVIYNENFNQKSTLTIDELMKEIKA